MKLLKLSAALLSLMSYQALASEIPAAGEIKIQKVAYHGSGCPKNSATVNLSPDRKALTVLFSKYEVSVDNPKRRTQVKKDCEVSLDLKVPDGWSFAVYTVDYRGYVALTDGATSEIDSKVRFRGIDPHTRLDSVGFSGPVDEDYFHRHELGAKSLQWAGCKGATRHLSVKSTMSLDVKKGASGLMTVDSMDGEINQTLWIAWARCKR